MPRLTLPRAVDPAGALLVGALLAAVLSPPVVSYEPFWEIAAGAGYAACCAFVLAFRLAPVPRVAMTPFRFALHRAAGDAALALVATHVAVMVAVDPFVLDYLGWMMPLHVAAGLVGAAALLLAVVTREPAARRVLPRAASAGLHAWAGIAAGAFAALHVLMASSKFVGWGAYALTGSVFAAVVILAVGSLTLRMWPVAPRRGEPFGAARAELFYLLAVLGACTVLFVAVPSLVRWLRS
ncbi:MAG TPA: hypothetical protein VFY87_18480 [Geminicoccaceae bacterium]|nr:hypothetical protein [Geminicoccaceae bacterium]